MTHPRGPLPARVYWVRRGVVLLMAFLLVFGLARLLGGGSDGSSGSDGTARQAAADTTSEATTPSDQPTESSSAPSDTAPPAAEAPEVTLSQKPSETTPAEPAGECAPEDVGIKPVVRKQAVGEKIRVKLGLRTTEEACTFEFSNDSVVLKITSGNDQIWSSQQCATLPTASRVLREGEWSMVVLNWNGRRSDEECSVSADYAKPGLYHVTAAALGGDPIDQMFQLTRAPREVITETAKPETDGDKKKTKKPSADESQPTEGPRDEGSRGADEPNG